MQSAEWDTQTKGLGGPLSLSLEHYSWVTSIILTTRPMGLLWRINYRGVRRKWFKFSAFLCRVLVVCLWVPWTWCSSSKYVNLVYPRRQGGGRPPSVFSKVHRTTPTLLGAMKTSYGRRSICKQNPLLPAKTGGNIGLPLSNDKNLIGSKRAGTSTSYFTWYKNASHEILPGPWLFLTEVNRCRNKTGIYIRSISFWLMALGG